MVVVTAILMVAILIDVGGGVDSGHGGFVVVLVND